MLKTIKEKVQPVAVAIVSNKVMISPQDLDMYFDLSLFSEFGDLENQMLHQELPFVFCKWQWTPGCSQNNWQPCDCWSFGPFCCGDDPQSTGNALKKQEMSCQPIVQFLLIAKMMGVVLKLPD